MRRCQGVIGRVGCALEKYQFGRVHEHYFFEFDKLGNTVSFWRGLFWHPYSSPYTSSFLRRVDSPIPSIRAVSALFLPVA
jgi:hypothetical protein